MLHLTSKVRGAPVRAVDGEIGTVEDFYFEQRHWTVRYLLIDTGKWMSGRRVMISPLSVRGSWSSSEVPVSMTKEQVWHSPSLDVSQPLSRGLEMDILGYYGHPLYWMELPAAETEGPTVDPDAERLRSTRDITGYHIQALDGEVGHVDDLLIGEQSWRIRYLHVDTSNWIGGKSVMVSSNVLEWIDSATGRLRVRLTRAEVQRSPSFDAIEPELDRREVGPPFVIL
jgi:hypothetical protein